MLPLAIASNVNIKVLGCFQRIMCQDSSIDLEGGVQGCLKYCTVSFYDNSGLKSGRSIMHMDT